MSGNTRNNCRPETWLDFKKRRPTVKRGTDWTQIKYPNGAIFNIAKNGLADPQRAQNTLRLPIPPILPRAALSVRQRATPHCHQQGLHHACGPMASGSDLGDLLRPDGGHVVVMLLLRHPICK